MSDHRDQWLSWMTHEKQLSPNTIVLYQRSIVSLENEKGELDSLTFHDLREWLHAHGGLAGTVSNRISALASYYGWLARNDLRLDNPVLKLDRPRPHKRLPKPIEGFEEVLRAADAADTRANEKGSVPRRIGETRDMILFLAYTGLRIHEAVACAWPVPCPEEAFVIGKGSKEELMLVPDKARAAWDRLGGQWGCGKDGKPIGQRATQRRFEKLRTPSHPDGIHPHMARHWRATSLVRAGVEIGTVSKIMRHESVQTTMIYSAYAKRQFRDALDKVG